MLYDNDWYMAFNFTNFLEVFYVSTKELSGMYYPMCHFAFITFVFYFEVFAKHRSLELFVDVCEVMEERFKNFGSSFHKYLY